MRSLAKVGAVVFLSLAAASAEPCSVCRCGDPTFNALGKAGYNVRGFRFALDWERYDKQEGEPELEAEELVEQRLTALAAYGFSDRFTLQARIPVSFRRLRCSSRTGRSRIRSRPGGSRIPSSRPSCASGLRRSPLSGGRARCRSWAGSRLRWARTTTSSRVSGWTSTPSPARARPTSSEASARCTSSTSARRCSPRSSTATPARTTTATATARASSPTPPTSASSAGGSTPWSS